MKNIFIGLLVVVLIGLGVGAYWWTQRTVPGEATPPTEQQNTQASSTEEATTTPQAQQNAPQESIGKSVEGRDIMAYHFGTGEKELLFVAGIHGGYEWNTVLLANQLVDYLKQHPEIIPAQTRVTVIPVLNPDGLQKVVGTTGSFSASDVASSQDTQIAGRFNANDVDLNRNFDCDWQSKGTWQSKSVSGGTGAFSEPESQALKAYVESHAIAAAVVWYSAAGGVFASNCHDGVLPETTKLTSTYATASGYKSYASFDFYAITGDAVNWLAKKKIPAISVLLTTHSDVEWDKNLKGITALLAHYAE